MASPGPTPSAATPAAALNARPMIASRDRSRSPLITRPPATSGIVPSLRRAMSGTPLACPFYCFSGPAATLPAFLAVVSRCRQQGRVGDLDGPAACEAVEAGAQAGAIGAELAELEPIALVDIGGQQKRPLHMVGAVAGRPVQREAAQRRVVRGRLIGPDAPRREAEPGRAGIAQAAVDAVIDIERIAAPQVDLHDQRAAGRDERPARLGPQTDTSIEPSLPRLG